MFITNKNVFFKKKKEDFPSPLIFSILIEIYFSIFTRLIYFVNRSVARADRNVLCSFFFFFFFYLL